MFKNDTILNHYQFTIQFMSLFQKIVLEIFVLKILIFYIVHIFNLINSCNRTYNVLKDSIA